MFLNTDFTAGNSTLYLLTCIIYLLTKNLQLFAGKIAIRSKKEVIYEEPDSHQPYNNVMKDEDMELKEYPTYGKPGRQADIELEDCPAYVEQKKEECLAYGESRRDLNVSSDACAAYEQIANLK